MRPDDPGSVVPLSALRDHDLRHAGAKAVNLARVIRLGLPVPDGVCVTTAAYRAHLDTHGLASRIEQALVDRSGEAPGRHASSLAGLRAAIGAADLDVALRTALRERAGALLTTPVAVRSSATAEDLPGLSFAGLHDSFLEITEMDACLDRIRACWASLWTDRAFAYRERAGIDHRSVEMAVIVQRLVPAAASGVLFTAEPVTGRTDRVVVEAGWGLGEAVVSGHVAPDCYVISKMSRRIMRQTTGDRPREGDEPSPRSRSIEPATVHRLCDLALTVEEAFDTPIDVEWAVTPDALHLLQVRPITTPLDEPSWEDRQVWTNSNAAEVLPDVATPMTLSVIEPLIDHLLRALIQAFGADLGDAVLYRVIAGRVYFNLNAAAAFVRLIPGLRSKELDELFGGRHAELAAEGELDIPEEDMPEVRLSLLKGLVRAPLVAVSFLTHGPAVGRRHVDRLCAESLAMRRGEPADIPDEALFGQVETAIEHLRADRRIFVSLGVGMFWTTALFDLCRRLFGDRGEAVANRLLTGLGSLAHAEAGLALGRLAAQARKDPGVARAITSHGPFDRVAAALDDAPGGRAFLEAWSVFLERHGHHARGEVELMNARWAEQPDEVLDSLRSLLAAPDAVDPQSRADHLARRRDVLARRCRRCLGNPIARWCFDFVLVRARLGMPIRENLKNEFIRRIALIRVLVLETGRRLAARGTLERAEDVFFLRRDELNAAMLTVEPAAVRARVIARRAEYDRHVAASPSPVIAGRYDPRKHVHRPHETGDRVLRGIGVSPGVVTGPARVILRRDRDHVRPGEVLVAPFTDPGWTPFFLNAAAIVMDTGGILSHGSIIAREYGIPCVVNVGAATELIRNGDVITVDGARGTVERPDHRDGGS